MTFRPWNIVSFSVVVALSGCSGGDASPSSVLRFRLPEFSSQSSQSREALDGSSGCYAIDVQGPGIQNSQASSCDPSYGQLSGLYKAGEEIELFVPQGAKRSFRLFYLRSSRGCTNFETLSGVGQYGSDHVYQLALKEGVDLFTGTANVELSIHSPSSQRVFEKIYNLPPRCRLGGNNNSRRLRLARFTSGAGSSSLSNNGRIFLRVGGRSVYGEHRSQFSSDTNAAHSDVSHD